MSHLFCLRVSSLSDRSGVPLSTIKYYIREGLLAAGDRSGPNRASYSERHVERLELIRALREVGGLRIEAVRRVLDAVDHPERGEDPVEFALLAGRRGREALQAPRSAEERAACEHTEREVQELVAELDWPIPGQGGGYVTRIAEAVVQIRRHLRPDFPIELLRGYADLAWRTSEFEFASSPTPDPVPMPGDDLVEPVKRAVLATILLEPVLLAFRSYAHTMRTLRIREGLPLPPAR